MAWSGERRVGNYHLQFRRQEQTVGPGIEHEALTRGAGAGEQAGHTCRSSCSSGVFMQFPALAQSAGFSGVHGLTRMLAPGVTALYSSWRRKLSAFHFSKLVNLHWGKRLDCSGSVTLWGEGLISSQTPGLSPDIRDLSSVWEEPPSHTTPRDVSLCFPQVSRRIRFTQAIPLPWHSFSLLLVTMGLG